MTSDFPETEARHVQDPVHNLIKFSSLIWAIIDTRQFQRLRSIKQLGVSYYIWPGASHNRFEHCLGVAYLARKMVEGLRSRQPELGISDRDVRCVEIAGLCHDLGHGPWSHVWDGHFIPVALKNTEAWSHEDASEMMFDALLDKNDIDFPLEDRNFVKDLIKGSVNHSRNAIPREKPFLFEIVANKRNGIDVDKFDYIARDCRAVGDTAPPTSLIIESARVINDEICYDIKHANLLYEVCHCRYKLHKLIYNHKTARAIEYMIVDALLAAEKKLKIAEQIRDPERYVYLTDDIMPQIEKERGDKDLEKSCEIFDRIRARDLYKCVDWKALEWNVKDKVKGHLTTEKIISKAKELYHDHAPLVQSDGSLLDYSKLSSETVNSLTQEDVIMDFTTLHYGMKERNPIDYIHFYGKRNMNQSFQAGTGDYATIRPRFFSEMLLRIYTKNATCFGLIQAGYNALMAELAESSQDEGGSQNPPTPPLTEAPMTPQQPPTAPPTRNPSLTDFGIAVPYDEPRVSGIEVSHPEEVEIPPRNKAKGSKTGTPFEMNKFAKVGPAYQPVSPSHKLRKAKFTVQGGTPPVTVNLTSTADPDFAQSSGGSEIGVRLAPPMILRAGSPSPNPKSNPSLLLPPVDLSQADAPLNTISSSSSGGRSNLKKQKRNIDDEKGSSKKRRH